MALIVVGILVETIVSLVARDDYPIVSLIGFAGVAVGVLGALLIVAGQRRFGAIAVIVSSVLFVPLGFVAMLGARMVMDSDNERAFDQRRRQAR